MTRGDCSCHLGCAPCGSCEGPCQICHEYGDEDDRCLCDFDPYGIVDNCESGRASRGWIVVVSRGPAPRLSP